MGRYGHHNDINYRNPNNENDPNYRGKKNFKVTQDYDSSDEQPEMENENPSVISRIGGNIKERYQRYNSDDARKEREIKKLTKRTKTINELSYHAKKENLKAQIRKSKQTAPMNVFGFSSAQPKGKAMRSSSAEGVVHFPKNQFGSMDRMLGLGGSSKPARMTKKKPASSWDSFDRMFGL